MSKPIEIQLEEILREYTEELDAKAEGVFKDIGKETADDLRATSPVGPHTKHYKDGWTSKVTGSGLNTKVVVYNKLKPSLTHLLENGHEVYPHGHADAHPHIGLAQQKATEELINKLRAEL